MASISFKHIKKNFGILQVIKELTFTIRDGEFFTFVGPSGCGKSTILNMIAGLEEMSGGTITFDGKAVNDLSPKERDVAMVFQSYALYPHMTVFDNMGFPLKMKKTNKELIGAEVRKIAHMLGIHHLLDRKPRELSGGQRQRVALGRAIIRKPKVFLMDEPLSNLDARLRVEMRAELKRLHHKLGITTIYVTHDQAEAMSMSERVAVLSEGVIQQCGTPEEIYLKPDNIMVAGFVGSPPMNFIHATQRKRHPLEVECNRLVLSPQVDGTPEGRDLILGVRPDDVSVTSSKREGSTEAVVSIVESAGAFHWVDISWGDARIKGVARIDEYLRPGDTCFFDFMESRILVFDGKTKKRI